MTHSATRSFPLLVLILVAGCTSAGAIAHKLVGPPPIKPQYVPPKDQRMLVLVENYTNPSATVLDTQRLALRIEEELRRHRIAPLVGADKLEAIRSDAGYAKMTIPAVARAVGAGQVLYVNVRGFTVEGTVGAEMIKGHTDMTVRVVDAAGETRWPTDNATGHPLTIETPWLRQGQDTNETTLRDQMSRQAATYIVKLFRKHHPDEAIDPAVQ